MHSDGIGNYLELQRKKKKKLSLKHALWWYLKRFWTAAKNNNNENKDGKMCIVIVFQTIWNCRKNENRDGNGAFWRYLKRYFELESKFENNDDNWYIMPLFDTIFWLAEKMLKAMNLSVALWRNLIRYLNLTCKVSIFL